MQGAGGVGGLISMTVHQGTNAGTYFYCFDGNHNVAALVNAMNGVVEAVYEYEPFLGILRATGRLAFINPFVGSTKFCDWETGFHYYGYRYCDADTGRWLSRDPIAERGGRNLYGFVGNNPNSRWDRLGQKCCLITYAPGNYTGAGGAEGRSWFGHSVLSCGENDDVYISHWPENKGGPWHTPKEDAEVYGNDTGSKVCTDCLDESKV